MGPPLSDQNKKQPWYIHLADSSFMCLAGIWEQWKRPGEDTFKMSFLILTTAANDYMAPIHDRMPVIHSDQRTTVFGLGLGMYDVEQLTVMCQLYPAKLMEAYKVSDLVNNVRFDGNGCIVRF
jgi:putative SOS response-associated peptidase YedK